MTLTTTEIDDIYDFIVSNKSKFIYKKFNKLKALNNLVADFGISFKSIDHCFDYLTNHWDKKCKYHKCNIDRKIIGFVDRKEFNDCVIKYGIYKHCGMGCSRKNMSESQMGLGNTSHRMSKETRLISHKKQSIKMKENIRTGKFIPSITNSWSNSRCSISFIRKGIKINIKTRSSLEAYFQLINTDFLYEKLVIQYKLNGIKYNYIIDFVDHINKNIYEIKPDSEISTKKNKAKFRWARKWAKTNGYNFIIIGNKWFYDNYRQDIVIDQPCEDKLIKNLKQFNENKKYKKDRL